MKEYLIRVFLNEYFLLIITAALGAALGKIKIKNFSLGSTGGIFSGIFVGWLVVFICNKFPETDSSYGTAQSVISDLTAQGGSFKSFLMFFFLLLFICAVGLGVGSKIRSVLNKTGVKLVAIGVLIPVVSMALTFGCLKLAPSLMGDSYSGYKISGMYSGSMTNSAALGTSIGVVKNTDIQARYQALDDEGKSEALAMIHAEDTTPTAALEGEQIGAFKGTAISNLSQGFAISFPVGTVIIILIMTLLSAASRAQVAKENALLNHSKSAARHQKDADPNASKPLFYSAVVFGLVIAVGCLLGSIEIPLGNGTTFSLDNVGGVLISALVFSNIKRIGPFDLGVNPKVLGFMREFALLFFMSVVGMGNGYAVVNALTGASLWVAVMAAVVEIVAVAVAILVGRYALKLRWGLLAGAINGGCTSSVGMGTAISTMDSDEPVIGYGISQPFAILANVLLISWFHGTFFI